MDVWGLRLKTAYDAGYYKTKPAEGAQTPFLWIPFALQLVLIEAFELGDDVLRGNVIPPNSAEAVRHAQSLVHLEEVHGLFFEPAIQLLPRHLHVLSGLLTYQTIVQITDVVYAAGQTIIPLLLAIWIFQQHTSHWPLVRTTAFLMEVLCVIGYELYPVAPPRLTTGLSYAGHAFSFQNATGQVIGSVRLNGIPLGYKAYSAMPSAHIAMALLVAGCVLFLTGRILLRLVAVLYPASMLFTVIVTGNHYLLDAAGGVLAVFLAVAVAFALEPGHRYLALICRPRRVAVLLAQLVPSLTRTA